ncbi:hypothetical protein PG985_005551 [Apiospora marii]|uniref:uncharacterized protein n=1 Tax=Apiospora marii TaxID=335849 RepID=UPI00312EE0BD
MGFDQQMLSLLAYELPQSPVGASCGTLIDPCIRDSSQHEPHQFFDLPTEQQDTVIKLEDIAQSQPWETFSSTSASRSSDTLEPVVPMPTSKPSRKQSVKKPRRDRVRSGSSKCFTDIKKEKNRVAASKCRRKKKEEEQVFEERRRMLQVQNRTLMDSAASLRAEVLSLKHEILRHGLCNFQPINTYIATAAARLG